MKKKPKEGQEGQGLEGLRLPIEQVDALRPMRRDAQPERGVFDHVGYGFEPVMDFGKRRDYQQNSPASPKLVNKGLADTFPPKAKDDAVTIVPGIWRQ